MIEILEINKIYNMDCMEGLIQSPKLNAIITDPPYMINTKSDGSGKISPWGDYCNGAYWYKAWFELARSKLTFDGCMWVCLNWRSLVTYQKAACDMSWPIESILVWDKDWIGPGGMKGLRPSYELVALFAMPEFKIADRGLRDIQRFPWSSIKPSGRPAEKPEQLFDFLILNSTKAGDVVCDPFVGSGTCCVSAKKNNRNFLAFEIDRAWSEFATERIKRHDSQSTLGDIEPEDKPEQMSMI